jgi:phosphoribosylformimino-5-aminoimidazole carboxamide ribonucleotide (ProFAR) isomerase
VVDVAGRFASAGVAALIVTQISRDGTLEGPDVEGLRMVLGAVDLPLVASGGVGTLDDLRTLDALQEGGRRLAGAIVGRALYEDRFTVADAVRVLA